MKNTLTLKALQHEVAQFAAYIHKTRHSDLFGVTDGKAIGTYIEHLLKSYLNTQYDFSSGSSAHGIDFPDLAVDVKVTSAKQPQSSSPFKDAGQKVYGLGYHLLVLVYTKTDLPQDKSVDMKFTSVVFVHKTQTADFQTTKGIRELLERKANVEDLTAFLLERNLPLDDIGAQELAARILATPPAQGYLTISNALQWRLQYQRVLELALTNQTEGVVNLLR